MCNNCISNVVVYNLEFKTGLWNLFTFIFERVCAILRKVCVSFQKMFMDGVHSKSYDSYSLNTIHYLPQQKLYILHFTPMKHKLSTSKNLRVLHIFYTNPEHHTQIPNITHKSRALHGHTSRALHTNPKHCT